MSDSIPIMETLFMTKMILTLLLILLRNWIPPSIELLAGHGMELIVQNCMPNEGTNLCMTVDAIKELLISTNSKPVTGIRTCISSFDQNERCIRT